MDKQLNEFLKKMAQNSSHISSSAYDTAWAAWLYPEAMDWLLGAQHPDGSWGAELEYYHDRVITTLAAIIAITANRGDLEASKKVSAGLKYLEKAIPRLNEDVYETVGFELLLPGLLTIAQIQGQGVDALVQRFGSSNLLAPTKEKLELVRRAIYSREVPVGFSLEFLGFEQLRESEKRAQSEGRKSPIEQLRSSNGSIHDSPAATAFADVALKSTAGRGYLNMLKTRYGGMMPAFAPFELFESAWAIHHLSLGTDITRLDAARPFIDQLKRAWKPKGLSFSSNLAFADLDDTALAFRLLHLFGEKVDPAGLEYFEAEKHFRCYPLERNISIDVHLHIIHALRDAHEFPRREEMLAKAVNALRSQPTKDFITDKWHVSPYYSTGHAIVALTGLADEFVEKHVAWLLKTQREDGSWTYYPGLPKAAIEETTYAVMGLQALYEHKKDGALLDRIEKGIAYLEKHYTCPEELPRLWITKILYNPYHIVESAVLAVFAQYERLKSRG
ncbi:hypothetical protein F0U62_05715 [Cystobacter fuscus]|uniref:prenyltransferase/squalene oxidase repeat-containing protein n=1 Tax=Cystobacter fuscus TaxID=43 RepID=UPI002B3092CA|nr:hypothetical protein F0U62_05715 [Cystobacter fuscus]